MTTVNKKRHWTRKSRAHAFGVKRMNIEEYIESGFPDGLEYNMAVQLCLRLFCTVEGIPASLHEECTKQNLAQVFTNLASKGFVKGSTLESAIYGANHHGINEKGHWVEIIASIFKTGDTVNNKIGAEVASRLTSR
jgi:hypothetical protein